MGHLPPRYFENIVVVFYLYLSGHLRDAPLVRDLRAVVLHFRKNHLVAYSSDATIGGHFVKISLRTLLVIMLIITK